MRNPTPMPGPACGHHRHGVIRLTTGRNVPVCGQPPCLALVITTAGDGIVGEYRTDQAAA
jgi:hypothetical protein